jgi:hypothetical protein
MKTKLLLAAALCVVAVVVVPIASASAAFKGTCKFHGTATITGGLNTTPPENLTTWGLQPYEFTSEEQEVAGVKFKGVECVTTEGKKEEGNKAEGYEAYVKGKGKLSCLASAAGYLGEEVEPVTGIKVKGSGPPGTGYLELPGLPVEAAGKHRVFFKFQFLGAGTVITFSILNEEGKVEATGTASFTADIKAVKECQEGKKPVTLKFSAEAAGEIG